MLNKEAKLRIEYNRKRRGARHLNHLVRSDKCTVRELDAAIYRYFGAGAAWRVYDRTLPMHRNLPLPVTLSPVKHIVGLFTDSVMGEFREFVVWPFDELHKGHFDLSVTGMRKLGRMTKEQSEELDKKRGDLFSAGAVTTGDLRSRGMPIRAAGEAEQRPDSYQRRMAEEMEQKVTMLRPYEEHYVKSSAWGTSKDKHIVPASQVVRDATLGDTAELKAMYPKGHTFWKIGGPELSPENYTEEERQASMAANAKKEDEANGSLLQGSPMRRTIEGHLVDRTDHPMDPLLQEKPDAEHQG